MEFRTEITGLTMAPMDVVHSPNQTKQWFTLLIIEITIPFV
jgi:hypothetical protein